MSADRLFQGGRSGDDRERGLYEKFTVIRNDGKSEPGEKHDGCEYFVLDLTHDQFAPKALEAYADACKAEFPALAHDLLMKIWRRKPGFPTPQ